MEARNSTDGVPPTSIKPSSLHSACRLRPTPSPNPRPPLHWAAAIQKVQNSSLVPDKNKRTLALGGAVVLGLTGGAGWQPAVDLEATQTLATQGKVC